MASYKIFTITPNPLDPLSFYRAMGPFRRMRSECNFEFVLPTEVNWSNLTQCDLVFAQRPFRKEHLAALQLAKKWGMKIVVDYDDYLFDLKTDNPAWRTYCQNNDVKEVIKRVVDLADTVFVTTTELKQEYVNRGAKRVVVVPNGYDSKLFPYAKQIQEERSKIVLWRGSTSHVHDCITVLSGFERLITENRDWIFVFMNQYPWFLSRNYPNVSFIDGMETMDYFEEIWKLKPAIMTHPLSNCVFNRCKSMACFLEATHAGAAFVGPNFQEFDRPGVVNYEAENPESFYNSINELIENPGLISRAINTAKNYVTTNLELGLLNQIRQKEFLKLING